MIIFISSICCFPQITVRILVEELGKCACSSRMRTWVCIPGTHIKARLTGVYLLPQCWAAETSRSREHWPACLTERSSSSSVQNVVSKSKVKKWLRQISPCQPLASTHISTQASGPTYTCTFTHRHTICTLIHKHTVTKWVNCFSFFFANLFCNWFPSNVCYSWQCLFLFQTKDPVTWQGELVGVSSANVPISSVDFHLNENFESGEW